MSFASKTIRPEQPGRWPAPSSISVSPFLPPPSAPSPPVCDEASPRVAGDALECPVDPLLEAPPLAGARPPRPPPGLAALRRGRRAPPRGLSSSSSFSSSFPSRCRPGPPCARRAQVRGSTASAERIRARPRPRARRMNSSSRWSSISLDLLPAPRPRGPRRRWRRSARRAPRCGTREPAQCAGAPRHRARGAALLDPLDASRFAPRRSRCAAEALELAARRSRPRSRSPRGRAPGSRSRLRGAPCAPAPRRPRPARARRARLARPRSSARSITSRSLEHPDRAVGSRRARSAAVASRTLPWDSSKVVGSRTRT